MVLINKVLSVLHLVHISTSENSCIIFGYLFGYYKLVLLGLLVILFKNVCTLNYFHSRVHIFKESSSNQHSLHYTGNIPTLTLKSKNDYDNGFIHGKILQPYIRSLYYRILFLSMFKTFPKQSDLDVPQSIIQELHGLVDGYNSCNPIIKLDYNTALLWHMLPMACTSAINNHNELVFARNMDWMPYGNLTRYTLVIYHKSTGVRSLAIPGLIGVVTGWNDKNLILAMNVCETKTSRGIPAVFNNRLILEKYKSVYDITEHINSDTSPYGAYHLTVLDEHANGVAIAYYQGYCGSHLIRDFASFKVQNKEIITYNHTYDGTYRFPCGRFFSDIRDKIRKENPITPISEIFKLYPINNWITCQSLLFYPEKKVVYIAFNNGFAASSEYHPYPLC